MNESQTISRKLSAGVHHGEDSFGQKIDSIVAKHKGRQGEAPGNSRRDADPQ